MKDKSQSELHVEIQFVPRGKHSPSRLQTKPRCLLPLLYRHIDLQQTLGRSSDSRPTDRPTAFSDLPFRPTEKKTHSVLFVSEDLNSSFG